MTITVSVSDYKVSSDPADTLVTHSLGSCIGVAVHDPVTGVTGLLHCQLPQSTLNAQRAAQCPAMFADTGMAALLGTMTMQGARKERLVVHLAGGASMIADPTAMNIGKRNHTAVRKILWQMGLLIKTEEVGGTVPRTVSIDVQSGDFKIKSARVALAA